MATKKTTRKKAASKKKVTKKRVTKKATPKKGRPTKYEVAHVETVYKLCLLGAIDTDIADFFNVSESTLNLWKQKHPDFSESMRKGKMIADSNMAERLYLRGLGYTHDEEKVFQHDGEIITHDTTKHYPPETQAIKYWLNNRQPKLWRDRTDINLSTDEDNLIPESPEEVQKRIDKLDAKIKYLEAQL